MGSAPIVFRKTRGDNVVFAIRDDESNSIFEVEVPESWQGRTIGGLDIRKKHSINIMAVKENGRMNISVTPDLVLNAGMSLLVLGEYKAIQKCFRI